MRTINLNKSDCFVNISVMGFNNKNIYIAVHNHLTDCCTSSNTITLSMPVQYWLEMLGVYTISVSTGHLKNNQILIMTIYNSRIGSLRPIRQSYTTRLEIPDVGPTRLETFRRVFWF